MARPCAYICVRAPSVLMEAEAPPEAPPEAVNAAPISPSRAQRFLAAARALFAAMGEPADRAFAEQGFANTRRSAPNDALLLEESDPCEEDCPICLTTLDAGVISTPCKHKVRQQTPCTP